MLYATMAWFTEHTDVEELKKEVARFLNESMEELGVSRASELNDTIIDKKLRKDAVSEMAYFALSYCSDFLALLTGHDGQDVPNSMKSELINTQRTLTKLQSELLAYKDNELDALKSTVKSTVESSVKSEFKSDWFNPLG